MSTEQQKSQDITITSAPLIMLGNMAQQACKLTGPVGEAALPRVAEAVVTLQRQLDQAAELAGELDKLKHAIVRQQEQAVEQAGEIERLRAMLAVHERLSGAVDACVAACAPMADEP